MSAHEEIKMTAVIATVGVTRTNSGRLCTEEGLRNAGDGRNGERYRYDEASQSLIYHGPNCCGAVYTFPEGRQ